MPNMKNCKCYTKKTLKKKCNKFRNKKTKKIEDPEAEREKDLSKMIDYKFKKNLLTFKAKREHVAKFIFWFSSEPNKTPKGEGYMFELPKKSRSIKDGFSSKEKKNIQKMFSNSKSNINSVSFQDGHQKLEHPTKLLERIFRAEKGHGPKITKSSVEMKYLFPPEDIFFDWSTPKCENKGGKWNCKPQIPILCVVVEQTFILTKQNIKEAIIYINLPYSLEDDYNQVYHGPGSPQWKKSKLDFDVSNWSKNVIERDEGAMDGVYSWKEGGFHFGLNDKCFKLLF